MTMDTCCDSKADLPRISFLDKPLGKFGASLDDCLDPDEPGMERHGAQGGRRRHTERSLPYFCRKKP